MRWGLNREARNARLRKHGDGPPALCPFGTLSASAANPCLDPHTTTEQIGRRSTPEAGRGDGAHDDRRTERRT